MIETPFQRASGGGTGQYSGSKPATPKLTGPPHRRPEHIRPERGYLRQYGDREEAGKCWIEHGMMEPR